MRNILSGYVKLKMNYTASYGVENMRPIWVIEDFDPASKPLAEEVRRQNMECHLVDYVPFDDHVMDRIDVPEIGPVVFQGSIQFARKAQRFRSGWTPGVICSWEEYECTNYYAHWGKFLLNDSYMVMPLAELDRRLGEVFDAYDGKFFLRPNAGTKIFSGTVITRYKDNPVLPGTWDAWNFVMKETTATDLVVVAKARDNIAKEWRVVVVKGQPLTASRYMTNGKLDLKEEASSEVFDFARAVLKSSAWTPDEVFVMDICEWENELFLLEIGAFSVAGLYETNKTLVVKEVSNLLG